MRVIAGSARRCNLAAPKGMDVRPTTDRIKETLFNILSPDIYGCRFLDLFCGSGAIGIEALSRGAELCIFADSSGVSCDCTKANLEHTKLADRAKVMCTDAVSAVKKLHRDNMRFDLIFMDPPYGHEFEKSVIELTECCDILDDDGMIVVEASSPTEFDYVEGTGLEIVREKLYGSNKHVFLRKKD